LEGILQVEIASAIRSASGISPSRKDQRSAVTNGRRLHVVRPGDTAWARRFRDVLAEIISDLRSGNDAGLSEGQRQLARRCATIAIMCERLEGEAAAGKEINLDSYGQMTDRLGRAFGRLGLKRQARDVTGLGEVLRQDAQRQQREDAERAVQQRREFEARQQHQATDDDALTSGHENGGVMPSSGDGGVS
jgi:hypothetical protein